MIARRSLLGAIIAAASGPAIVRASSLMAVKAPAVWVPEPVKIKPAEYFDITDWAESIRVGDKVTIAGVKGPVGQPNYQFVITHIMLGGSRVDCYWDEIA